MTISQKKSKKEMVSASSCVDAPHDRSSSSVFGEEDEDRSRRGSHRGCQLCARLFRRLCFPVSGVQGFVSGILLVGINPVGLERTTRLTYRRVLDPGYALIPW